MAKGYLIDCLLLGDELEDTKIFEIEGENIYATMKGLVVMTKFEYERLKICEKQLEIYNDLAKGIVNNKEDCEES